MDIRELVTDALRHSGYRVDAARDGSAAWDILQVNRYDVMVTENRMPKVTGVELLKKVRIARLPLPVIMATGAFPETDFARFPMLATRRHAAQALYHRQAVENGEKSFARSGEHRRQLSIPDDGGLRDLE